MEAGPRLIKSAAVDFIGREAGMCGQSCFCTISILLQRDSDMSLLCQYYLFGGDKGRKLGWGT